MNVRSQAALACLLTAGSLIVSAAAPPGESDTPQPPEPGASQPARVGFDPLSPRETDAAVLAAMKALRASGGIPGTNRAAVILVERHEEAKGTAQPSATPPRRADVFMYDYDGDRLLRTIVDLHTGSAGEFLPAGSLRLPPSREETDRALALALADERTAAAIRSSTKRLTGADLERPDQLRAIAYLLPAGVPQGKEDDEARACDRHRCVVLTIRTSGGETLSELPIVDLSRETIVHPSR